MYCAPGTVFHPRLLECTWPYCLPGDNECYEPCGSPCAGWTPEEIREQCADSHDVTTSSPWIKYINSKSWLFHFLDCHKDLATILIIFRLEIISTLSTGRYTRYKSYRTTRWNSCGENTPLSFRLNSPTDYHMRPQSAWNLIEFLKLTDGVN